MHAENRDLYVRLAQTRPIPLQVELRCAPGELLALTGPSGSGKTTVLRHIAGLAGPSDGQVRLGEEIWSDRARGLHRPAQARRVGFVFQDYALWPHLDVLEQVRIAIPRDAADRSARAARELLARVNLKGFDARRPNTLSGGQRQRVALARALARAPCVLLLDEPFSAVDQLTRDRLHTELARLRRHLDLPMILVSHDLGDVLQLADSVCLMHHGRTRQQGAVEQVLDEPLGADIARLLGHRNLYRGRFEPQAGREPPVVRIGGLRLVADSIAPGIEHRPIGRDIDVLLRQTAIVLHRRDRPSRGERENPVHGRVVETIRFGDELEVRLAFDPMHPPLRFRLSRHVARRNGVEHGRSVSVSILREGVHAMPLPGDETSPGT